MYQAESVSFVVMDLTDSAYPELRICEKDFFDCDAVQLAHRLLGKYLYFPLTDIEPIMIIDTEAYPFGDEVYTKILGDPETQAAIPDRPGVLFRLRAQLHYDIPDPSAAASSSSDAAVPHSDLYHLYIRARSPDPEVVLKCVVLIRSCMPRYLESSLEHVNAVNAKIEDRLGYTNQTLQFVKHNLLINPLAVARAVVRDFESVYAYNFALYEKVGCRLLFDPSYYPLYLMLHGRRVLDFKGKFAAPVLGVDFMFRFLFDVQEMHYNTADFDQLTPVPVPLPRLAPAPSSSFISTTFSI